MPDLAINNPFSLWEDYKKDFLAFLGWYLYPYKKS